MENLVNSKLSGKKVLLTGHTGFKGSWLSVLLREMGARIYGISDSLDSFKLWNELNLKKFSSLKCDIRHLERLTQSFIEIQPDAVIHMAAQSLVGPSHFDPIDTISRNVAGTVNVLEACRLVKPSSVTVVTSDKVYANNGLGEVFEETSKLGGEDIYSASKACCEVLTKAYYENYFQGTDTSVHTVRSGNVIGGGDFAKNRIIPDIVRSIESKESLVLRNPHSTRPWQHVLEPLSGYIKVLELSLDQPGFDCWNFGPDPAYNATVLDLVEQVNRKVKISYEVQSTIDFKESKLLSLNSVKARKAFNWQNKYDLEQTVDKTIDWYLNFLNGANALNLCKKDIYEYYNW